MIGQSKIILGIAINVCFMLLLYYLGEFTFSNKEIEWKSF